MKTKKTWASMVCGAYMLAAAGTGYCQSDYSSNGSSAAVRSSLLENTTSQCNKDTYSVNESSSIITKDSLDIKAYLFVPETTAETTLKKPSEYAFENTRVTEKEKLPLGSYLNPFYEYPNARKGFAFNVTKIAIYYAVLKSIFYPKADRKDDKQDPARDLSVGCKFMIRF